MANGEKKISITIAKIRDLVSKSVSNKELIARYVGLLEGIEEDEVIPDFKVYEKTLSEVINSGVSKVSGIDYDSFFTNLYPLISYWVILQRQKAKNIDDLKQINEERKTKTEKMNNVFDDSQNENVEYKLKTRKSLYLFIVVMFLIAIIAATLYYFSTTLEWEWARYIAGILGLIDPILGLYCWWRESKDDANRINELKEINNKNITEIKKTFSELMSNVNKGHEKAIEIYENIIENIYIEI